MFIRASSHAELLRTAAHGSARRNNQEPQSINGDGKETLQLGFDEPGHSMKLLLLLLDDDSYLGG
jgi:hypothetical protein